MEEWNRIADGRSDQELIELGRRSGIPSRRTHADLCMAYKAMGLFRDALGEAAAVMGTEDEVECLVECLGVVFSTDVMRPEGIAVLRAWLAADVYEPV
jgi:hypothetical protein